MTSDRTIDIAAGVVLATAMLLEFGQPVFAQATIQADASKTAASPGSGPKDGATGPSGIFGPGSAPAPLSAVAAATTDADTGTILGTVLDVNGGLVPGATVVLSSVSSNDRREVKASDGAAFRFESVKSGIPYTLTVDVKGFSSWTSASIVLEPSQFLIVNDIHLKMEGNAASVTVYGSAESIAVEQVHLQEQQRVFGLIPNFYVNYDGENAAPLTAKLKFKLALRVSRDPITILGVGLMAGINQAANRPDYVQGAKGYGQRFGAEAASGFSGILLGSAVLPSLLHQDPRYFYQGTGGTSSRLKHAVASPFLCRGDNGRRQINFSSLGGDLAATALSMTYYPSSNRSAGEVFTTFSINTAERVFAAIAQEFIIPRFTPSQKKGK